MKSGARKTYVSIIFQNTILYINRESLYGNTQRTYNDVRESNARSGRYIIARVSQKIDLRARARALVCVCMRVG